MTYVKQINQPYFIKIIHNQTKLDGLLIVAEV